MVSWGLGYPYDLGPHMIIWMNDWYGNWVMFAFEMGIDLTTHVQQSYGELCLETGKIHKKWVIKPPVGSG